MDPIALVRANVLFPFRAFLDTIGAPTERLLQNVGLRAGMLADGERLIPLNQCLAFLARAADTERLPDLGLIVGRQTPFHQLGTFSRLVESAPTLQVALEMMVSHIGLHNSGDALWLTMKGDTASLSHGIKPGASEGRLQGELFALAMMIAFFKSVLGGTWMPKSIRLSAGHAAFRMHHEQALGVPVVCAGEGTSVIFPRATLAEANRGYKDAAASLDDLAFLRATAPAGEFAQSVRQTIAALLVDGYPDIRRTADAIGLSVRTLQRRLGEAGETYSDLVGQVRFQASVDLLRDGHAKLIDIAGELGYADSANFTRAFRRWSGVPPRAFRRRTARS